jgi:hypothetical protein
MANDVVSCSEFQPTKICHIPQANFLGGCIFPCDRVCRFAPQMMGPGTDLWDLPFPCWCEGNRGQHGSVPSWLVHFAVLPPRCREASMRKGLGAQYWGLAWMLLVGWPGWRFRGPWSTHHYLWLDCFSLDLEAMGLAKKSQI